MIKAVIFDMDGVLVDSESVVRECMKKSAAALSLPFEDEFYELFLGCNDEMSRQILYDRYEDRNKADWIMRDFEIRITREYEEGNIRLKPGCSEIIGHLKQIGLPHALATGSSYPYVEKNFLNNGYTELPFDNVITGDKITNSKPDPEIFLKAAELLGIDIHDCLIIEDSPKGLEAALRSGARFCFVPDLVDHEEMRQMADYYRHDLFGVIGLIDELLDPR